MASKDGSGIVYEYVWVAVIVAVIAGLSATLGYYAFAKNLNPVCNATRVDLEVLREEFKPGVREIGPGIYEVNLLAVRFQFIPNEIVLEDPKRVVFRVASQDVIHGFEVVGTSVNAMVIPGYIAQFVWEPPEDAEGEYLIVCNEYCGVGHHLMSGKLVIKRSSVAMER